MANDPVLASTPSPFGAEDENEDLLKPFRISTIHRLTGLFS